jgi:hypothetical protein
MAILQDEATTEKGSFRDPSGRVIERNGQILREVSPSYYPEYQRLLASGLYKELTTSKLLIPHQELSHSPLILEPERVWVISYPYEWSFTYLKKAALTTLRIAKVALEHGMILKDATAYNMQWHNGQMILIDTLSFARYQNGQPWIAHRQFIEHFLGPLLLMAYGKEMLHRLPEIMLDGIDPSITSNLLPHYLRLNPYLTLHFYSQALASRIRASEGKRVSMPKQNLIALISSLMVLVEGLKYKERGKDWSEYSGDTSYTARGQADKMIVVSSYLLNKPPTTLCDMGANTGEWSRMAATLCYRTLAIDNDFGCVEKMSKDKTYMSLLIDICNPSPAIGWANEERKSFLDRLHVDTILFLALLHHLCLGHNIPLERVARMLSEHCKQLIIEFIPAIDEKAIILLGNKEVPLYNQDEFEKQFGKYFRIKASQKIQESCRSIYYVEKA